MRKNKRYFWFKLQEDFFTDKKDKEIKKNTRERYLCKYLSKISIAKSLRDNGNPFYKDVESDFIKEMALTLDENVENIIVTLNYLEKQGIQEIIEVDKGFY
ncbi:replication protein [Mergibacter septicus]|uniref:phage replisome organizer N-terminal domain-containing protein n=1 Tax=Mergibacter septicus TaxID=221402 RepID=UPI001179247E|nr:phage replisome organizer N-terminal domain-containing protein [Mergibacter septicus]AWX14564.1 replication protein [Mergibacter septicus]